MKTVAVTIKEGGDWIPWVEWLEAEQYYRIRTVHAIKFDNGMVWDCINGFRKLRLRVKMGRNANGDPVEMRHGSGT